MNELSVRAHPSPTLSSLLLPRDRIATRVVSRLAGVALGVLLIALAAQVTFHLPFTPVPYTGQTGAVLLVGTVLGSGLGLASVALYVLIGVAGAPVFQHGTAGIGTLVGPTGGSSSGSSRQPFLSVDSRSRGGTDVPSRRPGS